MAHGTVGVPAVVAADSSGHSGSDPTGNLHSLTGSSHMQLTHKNAMHSSGLFIKPSPTCDTKNADPLLPGLARCLRLLPQHSDRK